MTPKDYKFTSEHEWIHPESGNRGKVGLADYAQSQLGDIVFLDLPAPGTQVTQGKKLGEVESVKAVSDIFAPASGKVVEINQTVVDEPKLVNEDPYGAGWLVRVEISKSSELDNLMDSARYDKFVAGLTEKQSE
jgi:glycine cleavage system H protein